MIIAMPLMRMMKMAVDRIIGVVAVRDGVVPASGAMDMCLLMAAACMRRIAGGQILPADR
jgi:hypothetical protein